MAFQTPTALGAPRPQVEKEKPEPKKKKEKPEAPKAAEKPVDHANEELLEKSPRALILVALRGIAVRFHFLFFRRTGRIVRIL